MTIGTHHPVATVATMVSVSATTASLLNQLPTIVSVMAGMLTIVFMAIQILKAGNEWAEARQVKKLARIAQTVVVAKQITEAVNESPTVPPATAA